MVFEKQFARAIEKGFCNIKLDPMHLGQATAQVFTAPMNKILTSWYEYHMFYYHQNRTFQE